ncbi:MAG: anaerobic ribonucleoside-triphosphate reductase activating protein [Clostridia bacterium]|nr:anaerobic ribonucleoside-triphosphate reductase activating protein [Clostridia bacterium]
MNYADIKKCDVANGVGVRVSLFVSGCRHYCKGCFNSEAWDFNYGKPFTQAEIDTILSELEKPYIRGLSLLGGEPLDPANQPDVLRLLREVHEKFPDKTVWCYTGYDFEKDVMELKLGVPSITREILQYLDVVVDGEFIEELKSLDLRFRGSSNQRIIDVKKSLAENQVVPLAGNWLIEH